ncbi:unnamed protein product [Ambrosiozyma monospora]|uniref:Unnamed protein product n=1 Tax=Ambrosiozyma monospora TaxID=43982 RepID=A0ACB5TQ03_AMBMO|nr:unnamed protein product [Ambrosiozyma monospora]
MVYKSMKSQSQSTLTPQQNTKNTKPKKPKKPIPELKILRFVEDIIAVDAFCFAPHPDIETYILTHFHSDHYGGLCKSWSNGKRIIVTKITANLLIFKMRLDPEKLMVIDYNEEYDIPNTNLTVRCFDGNHCPGSGIFIIQCKMSGIRYLHCGDFRINQEMIRKLIPYQPFAKIYLDTTYLNPIYNFPRQDVLIEEVCRYLEDKSTHFKIKQPRMIDFFTRGRDNNSPNAFLIVIGTYLIGKERIAIKLAERLNTKIYCDEVKATTLRMFQWPHLDKLIDTENPHQCKIHLIKLRDMNSDYLVEYWKKYSLSFKSIVGLSPTGWSFKYRKPIQELSEMIKLDNDDEIVRRTISSQFEKTFKKDEGKGFALSRIIKLPYSEHSSFRELFYFVSLLQFREIIPTVNESNNEENYRWLNKFNAFDGLNLEDL